MKRSVRNKIYDKVFEVIGYTATIFGLIILLYFITDIVYEGWNRIDSDFLTSYTSRKAEKSGIFPAWIGSVWILALTLIISVPIGIASGIYFEEYAKKNKITYLLEVNIANLAGVPSIIYGLLGLEIFGRMF